MVAFFFSSSTPRLRVRFHVLFVFQFDSYFMTDSKTRVGIYKLFPFHLHGGMQNTE